MLIFARLLVWPLCHTKLRPRCTCLYNVMQILPRKCYLQISYSKLFSKYEVVKDTYLFKFCLYFFFCRHRKNKSSLQTNKLQVKHIFYQNFSFLCIWILDSMLYYYGSSCIENSQKEVIIKIQCKCILFYTMTF